MAKDRRKLAGGARRLGSERGVLARIPAINRGTPIGLIVVLLFAVVSLGGCSRVGFAYNWFFQGVLVDYVHDYADLSRPQYRALDNRLDEFIAWHRQQALPEYARFLRDIDQQLSQGAIDSEIVVEYLQRGEILYREFVTELLPYVTPTLVELDAEQLEHMREVFNEENLEMQERWAEAESIDERVERIERGLRRWIGPLEDQQRAQLAQFLRDQQVVVDGRIELRERWQTAFLDQLRQAETSQQLAQDLQRFFLDSDSFGESEHQQRVQQRAGAYHAFAARFINQLTPRQQRRLSNRLQRYADEFDKLALQ